VCLTPVSPSSHSLLDAVILAPIVDGSMKLPNLSVLGICPSPMSICDVNRAQDLSIVEEIGPKRVRDGRSAHIFQAKRMVCIHDQTRETDAANGRIHAEALGCWTVRKLRSNVVSR
jgi:hypothetical protein